MEKIFTPCIMQTLIIAVCIVIVAVVFLVNFFKNKWEKPNECRVCVDGGGEKRRKLHLIYISGITAGLMIIMFTYIVVNSNNYENVNDYFTFSASLVSIVLAVVTIVYSISTSESTSNSLGSLENTTKTVRDAAEDIKEATKSYIEISQELRQSIDSISCSVKDVKEDTSRLLDERLGKNDENANPNVSVDCIPNMVIEAFIKSIPNLGFIAMVLCKITEEKKAPIDLNKLFDEYQMGYIIGCLRAAASIGIIRCNINTGTRIIECVFINEYSKAIIDSNLSERIKKDSPLLKSALTKIESYLKNN